MNRITFLFSLLTIVIFACTSHSEEQVYHDIPKKDFGMYETYTTQEVLSFLKDTSISQSDSTSENYLIDELMALITLGEDASIAYVNENNQAFVDSILQSETIQQLLPKGLVFKWSSNAIDMGDQNKKFTLYAIRNGNEPPTISNKHLTSAVSDFDSYSQQSIVLIEMSQKGAELWSTMTEQNIHKQIAIVIGEAVYSCPRVIDRIENGRTQISGGFTRDETLELAAQIRP